MLSNDAVLAEIDYVLNSSNEKTSSLERRVSHDAILMHTIHRFAPPRSAFLAPADAIIKAADNSRELNVALEKRYRLRGVLQALRGAYERGQLQAVHELIRAEVFSDFLTMAQYLLNEGYKDPSAVLVGGLLEKHLRKLCLKNAIAVTVAPHDKPRKSSSLNDDLTKNYVYDTLEQKSVTAWLDLRNRAAHGQYSTYSAAQVDDMLRGVRQFLIRHRA